MFYRRFGKRAFDLVISTLLLLISLPLLVLSAVLIKLTSRGPVFFVQERLGWNGSTFNVLKFRTMTDRVRTEHTEIIGNSAEVTTIGGLLRRTKVDELPQLINVLCGDMSFIGPRPALPQQIAEYDEQSRRRLDVRPGMTGLAQINGNIHLSWPERWKWDVHYVDTHSFFGDLGIIVKSFAVVVFGEDRFTKPLEVTTAADASDTNEEHRKAA